MSLRRRVGLWALPAIAVVLATHELVYALVPRSLLVAELAHTAGNPHAAAAALVGMAVALAGAVVILWLAALAVRERLALEGHPVAEPPRLRPGLLALRYAVFTVVASVVFAYTESFIHWREGLGWHGLHCLLGPVHRDAIPILLGLSALAVALVGALEHVLAYVRRLVLAFVARLPRVAATAVFAPRSASLRDRLVASAGGARGPPLRGPASVST